MFLRLNHLLMKTPDQMDTSAALKAIFGRMKKGDKVSAEDIEQSVKNAMLEHMRHTATATIYSINGLDEERLSLLAFNEVAQALLLRLHYEAIVGDVEDQPRTFNEWMEVATKPLHQ